MGLRSEISRAAESLAEAGIDSAHVDAELLAAHVAGVDRGRLTFIDTPEGFSARYRELIDGRVRRVPLQHLTGEAPFGPLMLQVGPGVFIPRPETEAMLEWAMKVVADQHDPVIVDLCTGSGALAVALSRFRPDATVVAVGVSLGPTVAGAVLAVEPGVELGIDGAAGQLGGQPGDLRAELVGGHGCVSGACASLASARLMQYCACRHFRARIPPCQAL